MKKRNFKILLVYPNKTLLGVPANNLALLSACLKEGGYETRLFDASMYRAENEKSNDEVREKLGHVKKSSYEDLVNVQFKDVHEDFARVVEEYKPNLIAVSMIDSTISYGLSFIEKVKDKNIPVVVGGVGVTLSYEKILTDTDLVDFACIGEGERAIVELCDRLYYNIDCTSIRNICTKNKDGKVIVNSLRPLVDLDDLPMADYSIYDPTRFYRPFKGGVVRMLPVEVDRGCPHVCSFCAAPKIRKLYKDNKCGRYFRNKSLDKIFEQTKLLIKKHNIDFVWFCSETMFTLSDKRFSEFAKRYKKEINLPFWCQSRIDNFPPKRAKLLSEMGCKAIAVSVEHGNEELRETLLNKRLSNKKIIETFKSFAKYNIFPVINNMIGLPGETRENIFETIEFNKKVTKILKGKYFLNTFVFVPFRGTRLREICIERGYITGNEDLPLSYFAESTLTMPQISKEEIRGLEKTMTLYITLPKSNWKDIKIAEKNTPEGNEMFAKLMKKLAKLQS